MNPQPYQQSAVPAPQGNYPQPASAPSQGWLQTGANLDLDSVVEDYEQEREHKESLRKQGIFGDAPMKFSLKNGESAEILILDAKISDGALLQEHSVPTGRYSTNNKPIFETQPCIDTIGNCPLCAKLGKVGGKKLYLTILDLRPYQRRDKETGQVISESTYTRKLMGISMSNLKMWRDSIEKGAMAEAGTMRGVRMKLQKGANQMDSPMPIALDGSRMFYVYGEAEIAQYWGHGPIKSKEGHLLLQANANLYPYDYRLIFPEPDANELRRKYGAVGIGNPHQSASDFYQSTSPPPANRAPAPAAASRSMPPPAMQQQPVYSGPPAPTQQGYQQPPQPAYAPPAQAPQPYQQQVPAPQQQYQQPPAAQAPAPAPIQVPTAEAPTPRPRPAAPPPAPMAPQEYAPEAAGPANMPEDDDVPFGD